MALLEEWLREPQGLQDRLVSGVAVPSQTSTTTNNAQFDDNSTEHISVSSQPPLGLEHLIDQPTPIRPVLTGSPQEANSRRDSVSSQHTGDSVSSTLTGWLRENLSGVVFKRFTKWVAKARRSRRSGSTAEDVVHSGSTPQERTATPPISSVPQRVGKRNRDFRRNTNKTDSDEENRADLAKKTRVTDAGDAKDPREDTKRRYACLFYQNDPENNHYVSCSGEGFDSIHRLKSHIKNRHVLKSGVESRKAQRARCITQAQWNKLDNGFRKLMRGKGHTEKWEVIYKMLFPGETMPCAYVEHPNANQSVHTAHDISLHERITHEVATHDASDSQVPVSPPSNDLADFIVFVNMRASHYIAQQLCNLSEPAPTDMSSFERLRFAAMFPKFVTDLVEEYRQNSSMRASSTALAPASEEPSQLVAHPQRPQTLFHSDKATSNVDGALFPLVATSNISDEVKTTEQRGLTNPYAQAGIVNMYWTGLPLGPSTQFVEQSQQRTNTLPVVPIPPSTVNPGAMSISESDNTFGTHPILSYGQSTQPGHGPESFTTVPPDEARGQAPKYMGPSSQAPHHIPETLIDTSPPVGLCRGGHVDDMGKDDQRLTGGHSDFSADRMIEDVDFAALTYDVF